MKKYIKSDINSYSYTGSGFADDSILLAEYTYDDGYIELSLDGNELLLSHCHFTGDEEDTFQTYPASSFGFAARDFSALALANGDDKVLTVGKIDKVLAKYGKSVEDYGYYMNRINGSTNTNSSSYDTEYELWCTNFSKLEPSLVDTFFNKYSAIDYAENNPLGDDGYYEVIAVVRDLGTPEPDNDISRKTVWTNR